MDKPSCNHAACEPVSRRTLLTGAAALTTMAAVTRPRLAGAAPAQRPAARMTAAAAWQTLLEGNARYVSNSMLHRDFSANRMALAQGQNPIAVILSCADSRVAPELLFDQAPGDLFVIRVAGNFVNVDGLASIEYAMELLGTPLVVVMGHSSCGAVAAAIKVLQEDIDLPAHLPQLVHPMFRAVTEAQRKNPGNLLETAIEHNAQNQAGHVVSMSPIVGKYVASKEAMVVSAVYEIATGRVRPST